MLQYNLTMHMHVTSYMSLILIIKINFCNGELHNNYYCYKVDKALKIIVTVVARCVLYRLS